MPEARKSARLAIYIGPDKQKLMTNYTINMSTRGLFIETDDILPEDTLLFIKFKLPDNDTIIACNARVAWINEPGNLRKSSFPPGMGLQFIDLPLESMYIVRDYLNKGDFVPTW